MIVINELTTSYITEMEAHEVDSIFGGSLFDFVPPLAPDPDTTIAFTPLGANDENTLEALFQAIDYSGRGIVTEALVGGNPSFLGTQLG